METKTQPTIDEAIEAINALSNPEPSWEETILEDPAKSRMNATVRCDRCGAQAYVEVILKSNKPLYFCLHDSKIIREAIKPHLKSWYSEEVKLTWNRHMGTVNS